MLERSMRFPEFARVAPVRIEIKMQEVRRVRVIAARIPRIEIDTTQIDYPQQRAKVTNDRNR